MVVELVWATSVVEDAGEALDVEVEVSIVLLDDSDDVASRAP